MDAQNRTTHVSSVNVPTASFESCRVNEASAQINHLRITSSLSQLFIRTCQVPNSTCQLTYQNQERLVTMFHRGIDYLTLS